MTAPIITIKSVSKYAISDEPGNNMSIVVFTVNEPIIAWEARAGGLYAGSGLLVGQSNHLFPSNSLFPGANVFPRNYRANANTDLQFEVEDNELQQDGIYRINIYAVSEDTKEWNQRTLRKVRYIRDWLNGSNKNTGNHWVEIQAIDKNGTNVALGKTDNLITDGSTESSPYYSLSSGLKNVVVDLGAVYDIDKLKIWHYWSDKRVYNNTKTEISVDGVNWEVVFDSELSGTYAESSAGHEIII